jgi:hypothetical protein
VSCYRLHSGSGWGPWHCPQPSNDPTPLPWHLTPWGFSITITLVLITGTLIYGALTRWADGGTT